MKLNSIKLPNPNAVLYKDMKQKVKGSKLTISVFIMNLILTVIATIVLTVSSAEAGSYVSIDYSIYTTLFIVLAFIEFGLITLLAPAITSGAITMEREKQTFDVLLTTRLTPMQIIMGKYWASILQVLLLIVSGLPVFALVFIYGGVNFLQIIAVILVLIFTTMFTASLGILASSITKKTIASTVLAYVLLLSFLFGSMSLATILKFFGLAFDEAFFEAYGYYSGWNGDIFLFILLVNPLTTIYDAVSKIFGLNWFDSNTAGMNGIFLLMSDYKSDNFFLNIWSFLSIAVQLGLSYLFLTAAASAINPLKKRKTRNTKKKVKNAKERQKSAS